MLTFLLLTPVFFVLAHPGNTDSSGCHTCRTNCSSWGLSTGEYHCHNNKGSSQPLYPVTSTYGSYGTGYTTPAPNYAYPSYSTTPSCPINSYSSGSSCKCNYGYVVSGSSCVSGDIVCHSELGYGSSYDDASNKCKCDYGYVIGTSGQCVTTSSYCTDQLGLMSQYDSLSKKCECMSNYEYNGSSCVYKSSYSNTGTYSPTSSDCPLNSSESPTDSTKCTCNTGYQTNSAKDACVKIPTPTKTNDQLCQDSFGLNVSYNGTENSDGTVNCNCKPGYQWNNDRTSCVLTPIIPTSPVIQINQNLIPVDDVKETPVSKDFEVKDSDITVLDSTGTLKNSATFRKCPSTECSVVRYYAETSKLPISGSTLTNGSIWYRVDGTTDAGGTGQVTTGWIYGSLFGTVVSQMPTTTTPATNGNKRGWFSRFVNWF
jgi:hypothetical protein